MPYVFVTPPDLEETAKKGVKDSTGFQFSMTLDAASPFPNYLLPCEPCPAALRGLSGAGWAAACCTTGCWCLPLQALLKESLEKAEEESERIEQAMQELDERTRSIKVTPLLPPCRAQGWERTGSHGSFPSRTPLRGSNQ